MVHHGEHSTGTGDHEFDLISVLHNALESAAVCDVYIQDAEDAGDQELSQFFQELQDQENRFAERAKDLLAKRLTQKVGAS